MAFTAVVQKSTVFGNQRVTQYLVTADAASGVVVSNMGIVDALAMSPVSMATAGVKLKANLTVASAAANGSIFASSCSSGDVFFLTVFGH